MWTAWGVSGIAAAAAVLLCGCVGRPPNSSLRAERAPPPSWVEVGAVRIDAKNRVLAVDGHVNQVRGVIELLACGPAGKTHESVLVLDVEPLDLQTALILLGLKPGGSDFGVGVGPPSGAQVELAIEWDEDGRTLAIPAGEAVYHRGLQSVLSHAEWVFNGSQVEDGRLSADREQSFIATYWDPWAILNLGLPCGADDTLLQAHGPSLPPVGTPITLRLTPARVPR